MDKPRKPGKKAGVGEWDRYHTDMAAWKDEQQAAKIGQYAREQANMRNRSGWSKYQTTQDKTEDWHTKASPGFDERHNTFTTDLQIYDRHSPGGSHQHVVYDEYGNEIFNEWRERD